MGSSASANEVVILRTPYGRYTWNRILENVSYFPKGKSSSTWDSPLQHNRNDEVGALHHCVLQELRHIRLLREIMEAKQLVLEIDDGTNSGSGSKTTQESTSSAEG